MSDLDRFNLDEPVDLLRAEGSGEGAEVVVGGAVGDGEGEEV